MDDQTESVILPVLRHAMQAGGSVLATTGVINANDMESVVGILVSLAAVAWGICRRRGIRACQY